MHPRFSWPALLILLTGCASVELAGVETSPRLDHARFEKIMVFSPFKAPDLRKATEEAFLTQFQSLEINALASSDLVTPQLWNSSASDILEILNCNSVDGILIIAPSYFWNTSASSLAPAGAAQRLPGSMLAYFSSRSMHYTDSYINKANVQFDIRFLENPSGNQAWRATVEIQGNAFPDVVDLYQFLAVKITDQLTNALPIRSEKLETLPASSFEE